MADMGNDLALAQVNSVLEKALVATHPQLRAVGPLNNPRVAAANLRMILAQGFPGCLFEIALEWHNGKSVLEVQWVDGPQRKAVREFTRRFGGTFAHPSVERGERPGSSAVIEAQLTPWKRAFGWVDHLVERRQLSMVAIRDALNSLHRRHGGPFLALAKAKNITRYLLKQAVVNVNGVQCTALTLLHVELESTDSPLYRGQRSPGCRRVRSLRSR